MRGGGGADLFVWSRIGDIVQTHSAVGANRDVVEGFLSGADRLDVAAIDARSATLADEAFAFIGTGAFTTGKGGQMRYAVQTGTAIVQLDVNGDAMADMAIALTGVTSLAATDFML